MVRTAGLVAVVLVGLMSADSGRAPVINEESPAWRAGFAAGASEAATTPPQPTGKIVFAAYAFSRSMSPYARCAALFEVKHVRTGEIPVWPMPADIRLGTRAGLEYKAGWVERCRRTRAG
ncbi:hypothetical protein [Actinomadura oligospora]|uniref:hypothetical protein n=1 Tax=Actinomadura oligospora TaxID=111804 RepID=UPI0012F9529D|nr:hypothetical protein [Actinomadura oligospora]